MRRFLFYGIVTEVEGVISETRIAFRFELVSLMTFLNMFSKVPLAIPSTPCSSSDGGAVGLTILAAAKRSNSLMATFLTSSALAEMFSQESFVATLPLTRLFTELL